MTSGLKLGPSLYVKQNKKFEVQLTSDYFVEYIRVNEIQPDLANIRCISLHHTSVDIRANLSRWNVAELKFLILFDVRVSTSNKIEPLRSFRAYSARLLCSNMSYVC